MDALEIRDLTKFFVDRSSGEPFCAVDKVSFTVPEGSFVTLLGPSGCGKTTILRMIAGFEAPTSGEIFALGKSISSVAPEKRELPVVFQNYALFPHMTVFENVAYPLNVKKWKKADLKERVKETLSLMNLNNLEDRRPEEMSGGQQQRVALARALVSKPKIVLFDEPLSNLDAKLRQQMRIELKRLQRQAGLTALYVTHDQEEAMALSDCVIIMNRGRIEQIDTPENIYFRPKNRFVAEFIGKANFLPATVRSNGKGYEVDFLHQTLSGIAGSPGISGQGHLMVRPEGIQIDSNGSGPVSGTVTHSSFLGNVTICEVEVNGSRLLMELSAECVSGHLDIGQKVSLSFDPGRLFVLPSEGQ